MIDRRLLIKIMGLGVLGAMLPTGSVLAGVPMPKAKPNFSAGVDEKPLEKRHPILMLDAGHGGKDPGAIGISGTHEKNVTLDLVNKIAAQLKDRVDVRLTRYDDRFLALPERVALARNAQADLFISIHADSAPDGDARGLSVYTLSDQASDGLASRIAEGENLVDQRYGANMHANAAIADILYDLAARQTITASRFAKEALVQGVHRDIRLLPQPERSANFAVLRAPDVPSLLIETGFLSNHEDEKILADAAARQNIAASLAREIDQILHSSHFV